MAKLAASNFGFDILILIIIFQHQSRWTYLIICFCFVSVFYLGESVKVLTFHLKLFWLLRQSWCSHKNSSFHRTCMNVRPQNEKQNWCRPKYFKISFSFQHYHEHKTIFMFTKAKKLHQKAGYFQRKLKNTFWNTFWIAQPIAPTFGFRHLSLARMVFTSCINCLLAFGQARLEHLFVYLCLQTSCWHHNYSKPLLHGRQCILLSLLSVFAFTAHEIWALFAPG